MTDKTTYTIPSLKEDKKDKYVLFLTTISYIIPN